MVLLIVLALTAGPVAQAATIFSPQCTLPDHTVTYVSHPDIRYTLTIVWSCVFTLVACTWTVLHLNVPEQREAKDRFPRGPWRKKLQGDLIWKLKWFRGNLRYMLTTLLAPELTLAHSYNALVAARATRMRFRVLGDDVWEQWTLAHIFYANMGGFVLREGLEWRPSGYDLADRSKTSEEEGCRLPCSGSYGNDVAAFQLPSVPHSSSFEDILSSVISRSDLGATPYVSRRCQETFKTNPDSLESSESLQAPDPSAQKPHKSAEEGTIRSESETLCVEVQIDTSPYHLIAETILRAIKKGLIPRTPPITEDEIHDKAKCDAFAKAVALFQILWFCLSVTVRGVKGLSVSQLEIAVTAFSACSIVTYVLNFEKPKGILQATTLRTFNGPIPEEIRELQKATALLHCPPKFQALVEGRHISNDIIVAAWEKAFYNSMKVGGILSGSIHLIAWNFAFPSRTDQELWRWAAILTTGVYTLAHILNLVVEKCGIPRSFGRALELGAFAIYVVARIILLVETFRSFLFLTPDNYVATWTSVLPHIG